MNNVEDLIKKSLLELRNISCENEIKSHESKLIFPKYRDNSIRISEQEARLLLVREIENQNEFYYSIETPTIEKYSGFSTDKPKIDSNGRSASVDLALYKKYEKEFKRTHLIEFKFGNVNTCTKYFLKLLCDDENCGINYYINIIKNSDNTTEVRLENTIENLEGKYQDALDYFSRNENKIKFKIKSKLKIFVCILNDIDITENNIIEYQIIDKENLSIEAITERIK